MRQHEYSVLETIKLLHGEHTGTGPMLGEEYRERLAWLRWRVREGWAETQAGRGDWYFVETQIRDLGRIVVGMADSAEHRWRQVDSTQGGQR